MTNEEKIMETKKKAELFTVWVGGVEVNDYYLSEVEAGELAEQWIADGYDDVVVEGVQ